MTPASPVPLWSSENQGVREHMVREEKQIDPSALTADVLRELLKTMSATCSSPGLRGE